MRTILPYLLAFQCFFVCSSLRGQSVDAGAVHALTVQGIDLIYHLEFDSARVMFDRVIRLDPSDPRGYFFKGMVHFWIFTMNKDPGELQRFMALSDTVIQTAEAILDVDDDNALAKFYLGGAYGFRGLAHQRNGSIWDAVWDGRRGYLYLEEATEEDSMLYDAHMGFGLFKYLVAKVPSSYRWILSILGFSGDLEGGLRSLQMAADKGTYTRTEASFFLAQFLFVEDRREEAFRYLDRLLAQYPDNTIFLLSYAAWQNRLDSLDLALEAAERAIRINRQRDLRYGDELAYSLLSYILFIKNEFPRAKDNLLLYMEYSENKENISNWTYYTLGLCYDILGKRDSALAAYRRVAEVDDEDRARDTYYFRMARRRLAASLSHNDLILVRADNELSGERYDDARTLYDRLLRDNTIDDDLRAGALYGMMRVLSEKEDYEGVIRLSQELVSLKPVHERWLIPHGLWRAGRAYRELGRLEDARRTFEMIDDYDDYDFIESLERRVEEELDRLDELEDAE